MAFKSREVLIPVHAVVELEHGVYHSQRRKQARAPHRPCNQFRMPAVFAQFFVAPAPAGDALRELPMPNATP